MRLRIAFTRPAKLDLDELIARIGEENPRAAVMVATRIRERIRLLQEQPEIGRKGRRPDTRELIVDRTHYIVAYRVNVAEARVEILRILHSSRQWPEAL
ncbi:MAG: type II toxin-antitoxin system RelE/ParE family toxin [Minicystis sp.]